MHSQKAEAERAGGALPEDASALGHCVEHVDPFAFPGTAHPTSAVRGAAPRTWTDVELVGYALRRAARAAQKGYMLISAEYYALTYKILCKKCDVIEKLVRMAVTYCEDNVADQDTATHRPTVTEAVSPVADVTAGMHLMLLPPGLDQADYEAERRLHEQGALISNVIAQQQQLERHQQRMTAAMQWVLATLHKVHPDALPLSTLETCIPDFLRAALQPAGRRGAAEPASRAEEDDLTPFMPTLKTAEGAASEKGPAVAVVGGSGHTHTMSTETAGMASTMGEDTSSINNAAAAADDPARGFSLTLLFAVLLWNTANTMWQDGYIAHAAVWLRAVDVAKLQQLLAQDSGGLAGHGGGSNDNANKAVQGVTPATQPRRNSSEEEEEEYEAEEDRPGEGGERLYELSWRALLTSETPQVSPAGSTAARASPSYPTATTSTNSNHESAHVTASSTPRRQEMPTGRITLPIQPHSGLTSPAGESATTTPATRAPIQLSSSRVIVTPTTTRPAAATAVATPLSGGPSETQAEAALQLRRLCQRLLHHVTALRDLCAIIEACESTEDVLSYVRALDEAVRALHRHAAQPPTRRVRYQARRNPVLGQASPSFRVPGKAPATEEPQQPSVPADCMAEILVTLNIVVEFFLSRRAVLLRRQRQAQRARQAKLLTHSDSYARLFDLDEDGDIAAAAKRSPTSSSLGGHEPGNAAPRTRAAGPAQDKPVHDPAEAGEEDDAAAVEVDGAMSAKEEDEAVRAACDELVRAFTAGYYGTVEALETDGLPAHEAATTVLAPGLSYTLAVNVLSSTLNYVSMFRLSKIHRGVLTAAARRGSEPSVAPFIVAAHELHDAQPSRHASQEPPSEVMRRESPRRAPSSASRGANEGEVCSAANMAPAQASTTTTTTADGGLRRTANSAGELVQQRAQGPAPQAEDAPVVAHTSPVQATRARLRLPSRAAVGGLPLLAEEPLVVSGGMPYTASVPLNYDSALGEHDREDEDEISLRLLVLLHRYRSCHVLERVPPHVVVFTTQELNKALYLLQAQMRRHLGEAWASGWQSQYHGEMHHFYLAALGRVCKVDRGSALGGCVGRGSSAHAAPREGGAAAARQPHTPAPSTSVHPEEEKDMLSPWWARPLQKPPSADTLHRKREASASATLSHTGTPAAVSRSSTTTFAHELEATSGTQAPSEPAERQGALPALAPVTAMWDLPPAYIPDITVDFSAFTTSSLETQLATRQMVAERIRRQKELQAGQLSEADRNNITGVSLLSAACRQLLHDALPIPSQYSPWRVIYSTALHGVSLQTLLKNCEREQAATAGARPLPHWQAASPVGGGRTGAERNFLSAAAGATSEVAEPRPMLLVMELTPSTTFSFAADGAGVREAAAVVSAGGDTTPHAPAHRLIIGAYLSHLLCRESRRYYGNGETFVFQLLLPEAASSASKSAVAASGPASATQPQLRTYHASGHNSHFINCRSSSIVIGGGGMGSSLFIDDSLWHGATAACATFKAAPPLTEWATSGAVSASTAQASVNSTSNGGAVSFEILHLEVIVIDS